MVNSTCPWIVGIPVPQTRFLSWTTKSPGSGLVVTGLLKRRVKGSRRKLGAYNQRKTLPIGNRRTWGRHLVAFKYEGH